MTFDIKFKSLQVEPSSLVTSYMFDVTISMSSTYKSEYDVTVAE